MRIGIFTDTYRPQVNGVVSSIVTLEKELRKKGHKVFIITTTDPDSEQEPNVIRLPSLAFKPLPQYRLGMIYSRKIINKIKALNLDVMHSQTEWGVGTLSRFASKQLRVPLVHTYHTLYEYYIHYVTKGKLVRPSKKLAKWISEFYCTKCDSLVVPTRKVEKILKSYGVKKEMNIIPTGLDIKRFYKSNFSEEEVEELKWKYGLKKDDFICVYVGRIAKEKSLDYLLELFFKLEDETIKFLIVGNGPDLDKLKDIVRENNKEKQIIFTGEIPYETVPIYYQVGDVFLNASISETQGLTFVEAMAGEIPVNARYDDNLVELITDNDAGLLYKTEEEFKANIEKIKNDKEYVSKIKKNMFGVSQDYTSEKFGDRIEEVYKKTIERYKNGENFTLFRGEKFIWKIRGRKGFKPSEKGPWSK